MGTDAEGPQAQRCGGQRAAQPGPAVHVGLGSAMSTLELVKTTLEVAGLAAVVSQLLQEQALAPRQERWVLALTWPRPRHGAAQRPPCCAWRSAPCQRRRSR